MLGATGLISRCNVLIQAVEFGHCNLGFLTGAWHEAKSVFHSESFAMRVLRRVDMNSGISRLVDRLQIGSSGVVDVVTSNGSARFKFSILAPAF
jgi:hypothetical protein